MLETSILKEDVYYNRADIESVGNVERSGVVYPNNAEPSIIDSVTGKVKKLWDKVFKSKEPLLPL